MLTGGVEAHEGRRKKADHAADEDDSPRSLLAHRWQHGLRHANGTKEVRIEQSLRLLRVGLFDGSDDGRSGVVDSTSIRPASSKTWATAVSIVSGSRTSIDTTSTPAGRGESGRRTEPKTRYPCSARIVAVAWPMPEETPVTTATLGRLLAAHAYRL
jgi:hypothetical protein